MSGRLREITATDLSEGDASETDLFFALSPALLTLSSTQNEGVVAIQALAADVITHHLENGHRGLAVCGPGRGIGTTFIAVNLAVALSQAGVATMLIDANLHNPGVQQLFRPSHDLPGLQQLLREEAVDRTAVEQVNILPNLSIIFSGGAAADASELIAGAAFKRLIEACLRDYAFTIIDAPAANRTSDALAIANAVGHGLIVTRRDKTYVDDADTLSRELADDGVRVLGALVNG